MPGNQFFFIIDGDKPCIRLQDKRHGGVGKRDAVAVGFKTDKPLGGALHGQEDTRITIDFGQRNEAGLFFFPEAVDGFFFGGSVDAAIGRIVPPDNRLPVAIGDG